MISLLVICFSTIIGFTIEIIGLILIKEYINRLFKDNDENNNQDNNASKNFRLKIYAISNGNKYIYYILIILYVISILLIAWAVTILVLLGVMLYTVLALINCIYDLFYDLCIITFCHPIPITNQNPDITNQNPEFNSKTTLNYVGNNLTV